MTNPVHTLRFFDERADLFPEIAAQARASDANVLARQHSSIAGVSLENSRNMLPERNPRAIPALVSAAIAHDQHPVPTSRAQHRVQFRARGIKAEKQKIHVRKLVNSAVCLNGTAIAEYRQLGSGAPVGLVRKKTRARGCAADLGGTDLDDRGGFHMGSEDVFVRENQHEKDQGNHRTD